MAAVSSPDGLSVSPAFQQVILKPGEASQLVEFKITNNTNAPQTLNLSINDFNTLGESGGLFFVGTNPTQIQKKYGLAKWASLPTNQITVTAHQTATVGVNILNQPTLLPGGHYGALMLATANANQGKNANNSVAVRPVASSLMFVTKQGGETYNLTLEKVSFEHSIFSLPSSVNLLFHNKGNTHVIPRGVVSLYSNGGKLISKGIVNESSSIILPESSRVFSVPLKHTGSSLLPGRYKLKVDYRFDGYNQIRSYQTSFFVFPLISQVTIVLVSVTGLILWLRLKNRKSKLK